MTTRTWSSPSETSIIETVCNVCICPCPDIHLPIVRHQKYERMPEDGRMRVTVSMIRDLLHLSIVAALPSLVTHNGWSHRHTSHRHTDTDPLSPAPALQPDNMLRGLAGDTWHICQPVHSVRIWMARHGILELNFTELAKVCLRGGYRGCGVVQC